MPFWRNKKILLSFLCLVLFLFIVPAVFFLFSQRNQESEIQRVTQNINKESIKYKNALNQDQVQEALDIINNKNLSDKERYKALDDITFYFNLAYAVSHDPQIREYVLSLAEFAKKNFPKDYKEGSFNLACADPVCGEKIDEEFVQIQKEIHESGIDPFLEDNISENLEQAAYIPKDELREKAYGFSLAISHLEFENNPKASAAAQHIKSYVKKKYSLDL